LKATGCTQQCGLALEEAIIELLGDMLDEQIAPQIMREMSLRLL
jgi:hypothetical protein